LSRTSSAEKSADLYDVVTFIAGNLTDIVSRYFPASLWPPKMPVPFTEDVVTIIFLQPVELPFVVCHDQPGAHKVYGRLDVYPYRHRVKEITVRFLGGEVHAVGLTTDSGRTPAGRHHMLAYFAFPQIADAIRNADIRFENGSSKEWFEDYLNTLAEVSKSDLLDSLSVEDLLDFGHYIDVFAVHLANVSERLKHASFEVDIDRDPYRSYKIISAETEIEVETGIGSMEIRFIKHSSSYEHLDIHTKPYRGVRSKDVIYVVHEELCRLIGSDRVFDSVKRALKSFLEANVKAVLAYKLVNV